MFHGMMTIYKEAGYTSSDVVARLRGILHMRKIGHTGTLDPDAEGVLPVCLGIGTKLCELIADRDKEYVAVMRLGTVTDTQDMSGEVLAQISDEEVRRLATEEALSDAVSSFRGVIKQVPPMYSAVKINGKRLYELARQGKTVERKEREVTIHELEIQEVVLPLVTMRVRCSKGTYIRTLCQDIGEKLGTGAAMEHLLRTRVGQFDLDHAITLDEAEATLLKAAKALDRVRRKAAPELAKAITKEMAFLQMGSAEVAFDIQALPREQWHGAGPSKVELMYRPAVGLTARPLRRIASGGEVSRVMLAVKVVLGEAAGAEGTGAETLVFDEVDAGVGGATAVALAQVLARLAKTHQVIVVTHLAQVAVFAERHYLVSKKTAEGDEVPQTTLTEISGEDRVAEIARMLSGAVTDASLAHARELLNSDC